MAQETAIAYGIEFYVGRRSRDRMVSDVRAAGELVNHASLKAFKQGAQNRQKAHDDAVKGLRASSEKAMKNLAQVRKTAAANAAKDLQAMQPPSFAQAEADLGRPMDDSEIKKYNQTFGRELAQMGEAIDDFANRASRMGIEVSDEGIGGMAKSFGGLEREDRSSLIADQKHQVATGEKQQAAIEKQIEAKKMLEGMKRKEAKSDQRLLRNAKSRLKYAKDNKKSTKKAADDVKKHTEQLERSRAIVEKLVQQRKDLNLQMDKNNLSMKKNKEILQSIETLDKKITQEERKSSKIVSENIRKEREGDRIKHQNDRQAIQDLKEQNHLMAEYTRHIDETTTRIGSTLKNAFVIGTAAITALNYKLMGVVQGFQEFEKELINANSIWQESNETLFAVSDSVVNFGLQFGVSMENAVQGLYQYASAGVSASEAMEMLTHTLKLSMAVQGDHNTLSKLTVQTIKGFSMEFSEAGEVTDKFAHAINKSLIEWDDLASSIKFALPFFISTGQSLDQLLGGLQILTDRALEAGIAGRGLRQALAEFTQHADDNASAFRKMGIEILDAQNNMKPLNVIAQEFKDVMGEGVTDMEVMIALMEDLNFRGATAFIHLVQNAEEFTAAVGDLQNSAGSATLMAETQQKSLTNQIQVVKTALMAPFLLSDKVGAEAGYLNQFAMEIHNIVDIVEGLFIKTLADGSTELADMGILIRDFVIGALKQAGDVLHIFVGIMKDFAGEGHAMTGMLRAFTLPLKILANAIKIMGPGFIEAVIGFKMLNKLMPINSMHLAANIRAMMIKNKTQAASVAITKAEVMGSNGLVKVHKVDTQWRYIGNNQVVTGNAAKELKIILDKKAAASNAMVTVSYRAMLIAQLASQAAMFGAMLLTQKYAKANKGLAAIIGAVAGAIMGVAIAIQTNMISLQTFGWGFAGAAAVGAAAGVAFNVGMQQMMAPPDMTGAEYDTFDTGGRFMPRRPKMYDMGGPTPEHGLAVLQKGETVIPKTQNMLGGGADGGITLYIQGDVYDGDNFAEKISEALPKALRNINDAGGI